MKHRDDKEPNSRLLRDCRAFIKKLEFDAHYRCPRCRGQGIHNTGCEMVAILERLERFDPERQAKTEAVA